jgi:hypothetical protein
MKTLLVILLAVSVSGAAGPDRAEAQNVRLSSIVFYVA